MTSAHDSERIGGFRFLDVHAQEGEGGQGCVRKAVCETAVFPGLEKGTVVALKIMQSQASGGDRYEELAARTDRLVRIKHPNVVRYYGCFVEKTDVVDLHVVVQEFLTGETLKERLLRSSGGLDADEALRIVRAASAGLACTASHGIVHCDVKPGNIFLCEDGGVKMIDFEIAHHTGEDFGEAGDIVGSFDYLAPEHVDASFCGDEISDVFSMGVVLHEALTGDLPYGLRGQSDGSPKSAFFARWGGMGKGGRIPSAVKVAASVRHILGEAGERVLADALASDRLKRCPGFSALLSSLQKVACLEFKGEKDTYRFVKLIGAGGFGEVFKACRREAKDVVAVKHLFGTDAKSRERFRHEAVLMSRFDDSCFVRFIEFFEAGPVVAPQAYIAMAFLPGMPGSSLREAILSASQRPLPPGDVLRAFIRYARGLALLHGQDICHRDIKPSNLYYPKDALDRAAIMDLGIARDWNETITQNLGTPDYMPPEVILGESGGSASADIFALGLCLYEALTGRFGYPRFRTTGTAAAEAYRIRAQKRQPPRFSASLVERNAGLRELLSLMTDPNVERRMKSAGELELALSELLDAYENGEWVIPANAEENEPTAVDDDADTATGDSITGDLGEVDKTVGPEVPPVPPAPTSRRSQTWKRVALVLFALGSAVVAAWFGVRFRLNPARMPDSPATGKNAGRYANEDHNRMAGQLEEERKAKEKLEQDLIAARKLAEELEKARRQAEAAQKALVAEQAQKAEEARKAEEKRLAEEARRAEEERKAEAARRAEAARKAEEERKAEEKRLAAERERKRQEAAKREAERLAAEKKAREEKERRTRNLSEATAAAKVVADTYGQKGMEAGDHGRTAWKDRWKQVLEAAEYRALDSEIEVARLKRKDRDARALTIANAKLAATKIVDRYQDASVPLDVVRGERTVWETMWRPQLPPEEFDRLDRLMAAAEATRPAPPPARPVDPGIADLLSKARIYFEDEDEMNGLRLFAEAVRKGHVVGQEDRAMIEEGFGEFRRRNLAAQEQARTRPNSNYSEDKLKRELHEARECYNIIKNRR